METFIKALGWLLLIVVGGGAMLLGFATVGVGWTLVAIIPLWLLYVVRSGSHKRWGKGVQDTYREGQRIQQEREAATKDAPAPLHPYGRKR
jgi:hypothetical protein